MVERKKEPSKISLARFGCSSDLISLIFTFSCFFFLVSMLEMFYIPMVGCLFLKESTALWLVRGRGDF